MKGHYAGKSHVHKDMKKEMKKMGPEIEEEEVWFIIDEFGKITPEQWEAIKKFAEDNYGDLEE